MTERVVFVGTPEGRVNWHDWQLKTAAEVADDIRAALAGIPKARWGIVEVMNVTGQVLHVWVTSGAADAIPIGQDRRFVSVSRTRPDAFNPDLLATQPPPKAPPVIAHAPPARRGRWGRG